MHHRMPPSKTGWPSFNVVIFPPVYYSSLLVHLKDILKQNAAGSSPRVSCSCTMPRLTGHLQPRRNWPGLPGLPMSWSPTLFSGSGPVGLPPVPWTEKTIKRSPFFVRRGGHCYRGDLFGRTTFWPLFFCFSGLQKLEQRAKKCIELRGEYVE